MAQSLERCQLVLNEATTLEEICSNHRTFEFTEGVTRSFALSSHNQQQVAYMLDLAEYGNRADSMGEPGSNRALFDFYRIRTYQLSNMNLSSLYSLRIPPGELDNILITLSRTRPDNIPLESYRSLLNNLVPNHFQDVWPFPLDLTVFAPSIQQFYRGLSDLMPRVAPERRITKVIYCHQSLLYLVCPYDREKSRKLPGLK